MLRKLALSLLLTVCSIAVSNFSYATTITYSGGPISDYTLGANDTLYIASGTYTGTVSGLNGNNRTIIVANGATFQPTLLQPDNGVVCKMFIYGTFTYNQPLTTNTNFTIDVYAGGVMNLTNTMDTKGRDQVWTNNIGGTMNFYANVSINGGTQSDDNNVFINYETVNAYANFTMRSGSRFMNYKNFNVSGNYTANGGILNNQGNFIVTGAIDMNNGASQIINYCRMETYGGVFVSSGNFYNYTYLWARNSDITVTSGAIQNIQIPQASPPIIHGRNYLQTGGSLTGPALLYFYGTTETRGGSIVGVTGVTADTIKMNDITRTNPTTIFDLQATGTVRPNVIYNAWGVPDSTRIYMFGCSFELFQQIPLAITWNYFYVSLSNNIPVLSWSAEHEPGAVFEIQRSYDGASFQAIKNMPSEVGRAEYSHNDGLVNTQSPVVFYRIKAIGLNGAEKFTQIRTVRFRNNHGVSIYVSPNPFTSNFIIDYTATDKEMITVRIFNVNGQQQLVKNISVNKGNNIINITEAARLSNGVYVVQVSNEHSVLSASKIIKR